MVVKEKLSIEVLCSKSHCKTNKYKIPKSSEGSAKYLLHKRLYFICSPNAELHKYEKILSQKLYFTVNQNKHLNFTTPNFLSVKIPLNVCIVKVNCYILCLVKLFSYLNNEVLV